MDEIAREAGLTKPMLYATFGDKAGLAGALAENYLSRLMPEVLAAFEGDRHPREMVRSAIDTFVEFVERDPQVYRFLVRGVGGAASSFIEQRLIAQFGLQLALVLRTALRAAGTDTGPSEVWAFSILGTVICGAEWWLARPTMSRRDLVDYLTAFVWGGLSAGGINALGPGLREPTESKSPSSNEE
jgi:AcrR family transcriptional regulator